MGMQTGENEQGLRKILDMTRLMGIGVLGLHFYYYCYGVFEAWGLETKLSDRVLENVWKTGLFESFLLSKVIALGLLAISMLGIRGRKNEKANLKSGIRKVGLGLVLYFVSYFVFHISSPYHLLAWG